MDIVRRIEARKRVEISIPSPSKQFDYKHCSMGLIPTEEGQRIMRRNFRYRIIIKSFIDEVVNPLYESKTGENFLKKHTDPMYKFGEEDVTCIEDFLRSKEAELDILDNI